MSVVSLHGGPTGERERSEACVATLRRYLEMAEAGEISGVALVGLYHDGAACWHLGGRVGGYSMLGALEMVRSDLVEVNKE